MGQWFHRPGNNLATVARETGYPVVEIPGWSTRGHGPLADAVRPVVCHHTAGPEPEQASSNYPSLAVVRDGRADLPGPLSHYGLGFDGTIYVVAAGLAYHAGEGSWKGWTGNACAIGIEAEDGGDGDWTPAQRDAYPRLVARICQFLGVGAEWVCGHKEWSPGRKIDPAGIDMTAFRRQVAAYLTQPDTITAKDDTVTPEDRAAIAEAAARQVWNTTLTKPGTDDKTWAARQFQRWGYAHALAALREGRQRDRTLSTIQAEVAALRGTVAELAKALAARDELDADTLVARVRKASELGARTALEHMPVAAVLVHATDEPTED